MKSLFLGSCCVAAGLASAAACATADNSVEPDAGFDASSPPVVEPDATPTADATTDAPLDAPAVPIDCATVHFCPEAAPLSPLASLNAVWGSGPDDVWAVGTRGTILHRENAAFVAVGGASSEMFYSVWGAGAGSDPWILGSTAPYRLQRGASGFELQPAFYADYTPNPFTQARLWAIGGSSDTDVILAGQSSDAFGGITASVWGLGTSAGGELAWNQNPTVRGADGEQTDYPTLRALFARGTDPAWAVGENGQSYRRIRLETDADTPRTVWQYVPTEAYRTLESVWASGPDDVWAVGALGTIQHFDLSGAWHLQASPTAVALHGVWGSGPSDVWAVGDEGVILHFDGTSWRLATAAFDVSVVPNLYGVWGTGTDVWVVGSRGVLHRTNANRSMP